MASSNGQDATGEGHAKDGVFLGIDTAGSFLALALWSPSTGPVASFVERVEREHARRIVAELDRLMIRSNVTRAELRGIGVGVGPGSYTGVRVGVATARGLGRGLGVAVAGGGSLEALAYASLAPGERGVAALDARRGFVYAGVYAREGDHLEVLAPVAREERAAVRARHPGIAWFEDVAPDATYLARVAWSTPDAGVEPRYL